MGNCSAAFPPSAATLFVSPTATVDATHFTTIQAAISAAPSGAIIAVDTGTYDEALTVASSVSIVGRCAASVIVMSPDGTKPGIATSAPTLSVSGLTLKGHLVGVNVSSGDTTLTSVFINGAIGRGVAVPGGAAHIHASRIFGVTDDSDGNGFGLDVPAGTLDIDGSAIVKSGVAGINATSTGKATLTGTILRDTDGGNGADGQGVGAAVSGGGHLDFEGCALTGNHVANAVVLDPHSNILLNGSVVRGAIARTDGTYGDGIIVMPGGEVDVTSSTIEANGEWGITSDGPASTVSITSSVIRGGVATARGGIAGELGTTLTAKDLAIVGVRSEGIVIQDKASAATLTSMLVRDVAPTVAGAGDDGEGYFIGVGATAQITDITSVNTAADAVWVGGDKNHQNGAQATITQLLAINTQPGKDGRFGRGLEVGAGGNATVQSSAFSGNAEAAVVVDAYGSATVTGCVLRTSGTANTSGFGFLVVDNATASLMGSWVREINGVGLAFGGNASARIDSTFVLNNQIGVYADTTTSLDQLDSQPDELDQGQIDVTNTQFVGNATRVSSTSITLPSVNVGM